MSPARSPKLRGPEVALPVALTLKVYRGDALVMARDFDRDMIRIGKLSTAHLCLEDEKVSRIHAVIEAAPDGSLSEIGRAHV